jgi:lipopolysaccharide export system protein LptC
MRSSHRPSRAAALHVSEDPISARDGAFRAARRHSRLVRFLRRALPVLTLSACVIVFLWVWLDPLRFAHGLGFDLARLVLSGNKLTMEAPKLSGFTRDGRAYSISARAAAQDLTKPHIVELSDVEARLVQPDQSTTELSAKSGTYDSKEDRIYLTGGIKLNSTAGYKGALKEAMVEVRKGRVVSEQPVDFAFNDGNNDGTIRGDRLEIQENGARILLEGGVVMTFKMPPEETPAVSVAPRKGAAR